MGQDLSQRHAVGEQAGAGGNSGQGQVTGFRLFRDFALGAGGIALSVPGVILLVAAATGQHRCKQRRDS